MTSSGQTLRYRVRHLTTYRYSEPVAISHNVARLAPRQDDRQRVIRHELTVSPQPAVAHERVDWFGNRVGAFTVQHAHRELAVRAVSEVEVRGTAGDIAPTPWEDAALRLRGAADVSARAAAEFRFASPLVPLDPELAELAAPAFAPGRPLAEAASDLCRRIHDAFAYDSRATSVTTPLREVLRLRRGVCQDFAQVLVGCLRALGLAARYVSGYLETDPPPGRERLVGADASHAWTECWLPHGDDGLWLGLDPTNACPAGNRHIVLAVGRDFSDVSPLKGLITGGGPHTVSVAVDVQRIVGAAG